MANIIRRKWPFLIRDNDPLQGKPSPPKPARSKHSFLKSNTSTKFERRKATSLHNVPDTARPKSENFTHACPKDDDESVISDGALNRSESAPMLTTLHNRDPAETSIQGNKRITFEATRQDNEPVPDGGTLPVIDNLDESDLIAHVSTPDSSSAAMHDHSTGQTSVPRMDTENECEHHIELTDSGTAPTQILDVSDGLPEDPPHLAGPTITKTLSQVLERLREVYGPSYQQTDDIAGIELPQSAELAMEYLSRHDISIRLNSMPSQMIDKTGRVRQTSIVPWLPAPSLYSEALRKAGSSVDKQTGLTRSYVNSWIFMSLAMSRIDGLRFIFTIYLSFWICGFDASSLSAAQAATATQQEWFRDASNISLEDRELKKTVLRSGCRTGLRTEPNSRNSSKVAAVISGPDRNGDQDPVMKSETAPMSLTTSVLLQQTGYLTSGDEAIEESTDDETQHPLSHLAPQPDPQKNVSSDLHKNRSSGSGETELREPESDEVTDNKADQTTDNPLPKPQSDVSENQEYSRSSSRSKTSESKEGRRGSERTAGFLPCEDPKCEKTFANKSELIIHMEIRHQDTEHSGNARYSVPLPRSQHGLLTPDESELSTDERSVADQRRRKERSLPYRSVRQQVLPLDRKFRIRSGNEAVSFFVRGRVFDVVWHENSSPSSSIVLDTSEGSSPNLSLGSYGELVLSYIRRFVVVKAHRGSCLALPIYVFNGKVPNQNSLAETQTSRHTITYDRTNSPETAPYKAVSTKESIAVDVEEGQTWYAGSRLNFDMPQSIEWETKVKNIGMVRGDRDLHNLMVYFNTELQRGEDEGLTVESSEGEQKGNVNIEQNSRIVSNGIRSNPSISWE